MNWNYRVIKHKNEGLYKDLNGALPEELYVVHEVYYTETGGLMGYCEDSAMTFGESLQELGEVLDMMRAALDKPVLTEKEFS